MQHDAFIGLRLPAEVNESLVIQAERYGKSKSAFIRQIVETYLKAMKGAA
ncbi:hypothetical protein LMIY3S_04761 [Labrys miyagiensis]